MRGIRARLPSERLLLSALTFLFCLTPAFSVSSAG
jgi:hypothetical protein